MLLSLTRREPTDTHDARYFVGLSQLMRSGRFLSRNSSILSEVTRRSSPDKTGGNRIAASVRIEAFEGSRWRLRRTRLVCVLNGVLVLRYCILTGIPPCRW